MSVFIGPWAVGMHTSGQSPFHHKLTKFPAESIVPMESSSVELPNSFYLGDHGGRALFSTKNGEQQKRTIELPFPASVVRTSFQQDVYNEAKRLRSVVSEELYSQVRQPRTWYDLYDYFDAYDIYVKGALFCCQVLNEIFNGNEHRRETLDRIALRWITEHPESIKSISSNGKAIDLATADLPGTGTFLHRLSRAD